MRVFVSSTVHDLIDMRAEVRQLLTDLHLSPVMSDELASDFKVPGDGVTNSIATCLENVRASDAVLVILSQRYGGILPEEVAAGRISATHAEFREAVKHNKPVFFYVRDRLAGEYDLYRGAKDDAARAAIPVLI